MPATKDPFIIYFFRVMLCVKNVFSTPLKRRYTKLSQMPDYLQGVRQLPLGLRAEKVSVIMPQYQYIVGIF